MKVKNSILYLTLALAAAGSLYLITRANSLENKLDESNTLQTELVEQLGHYQQLIHSDSILLNGDYNTAIQSYSATMKLQGENKMSIPLRIALAEKLLQEKQVTADGSDRLKTLATNITTEEAATPADIRKYDSLNFTLEKTKVQLVRLQRQLQDKSFGEYLKFKSKKGNQMHYVGQVKHGKANGFGIALLDSGSRYEGQWNDNQREGEGTFYWPDGEFYVGNYKQDKRSGFGTYYWPNGEKYAGEWKDDKRSGSGKFFGTDGDVVAGGEWNDDELIQVTEK